MNFSIIKASFPIDNETYEEIKELCEDAGQVDHTSYHQLLNLNASKEVNNKGFFVLAYDNDLDRLVGAASAIDIMGLNTYEWSMIVSPMYRKIGIGTALFKVLHEGLVDRGAEGELALVIDNDTYGKKFLEKYGFQYSFSEATLEANAGIMVVSEDVFIRPYSNLDQEALVEIYSETFGDLREESLDLIDYNTRTEGHILWVAEFEGKIVGTVTTTKEGEVQWVTALAVHPEMQGRGIGTVLLNWTKDFTLRNGEKLVMLDVEVENERALAVYEKAGFIKSMQVDFFVFSSRNMKR
nr:GNAT family N-acetyltransferase [Lysinibacillus timonensis]